MKKQKSKSCNACTGHIGKMTSWIPNMTLLFLFEPSRAFQKSEVLGRRMPETVIARTSGMTRVRVYFFFFFRTQETSFSVRRTDRFRPTTTTTTMTAATLTRPHNFFFFPFVSFGSGVRGSLRLISWDRLYTVSSNTNKQSSAMKRVCWDRWRLQRFARSSGCEL
jgi:hypothetical protein